MTQPEVGRITVSIPPDYPLEIWHTLAAQWCAQNGYILTGTPELLENAELSNGEVAPLALTWGPGQVRKMPAGPE